MRVSPSRVCQPRCRGGVALRRRGAVRHRSRSRGDARILALAVLAVLQAVAAGAQPSLQSIDQSRGVDSRVDYRSLTRFGPWDDRNYRLTVEELALLAPDEASQSDPIPAFFRVELRRARPELRRRGPAQYPRSALQIFRQLHTGYRIDGRFYRHVVRENGRYRVLVDASSEVAAGLARFLSGEVRVTSPVGAAESAIKVSPGDPNVVIAGSNGPGGGQRMHYSTDGGASWQAAAALPLGGSCCDPTVDWKADGSLAYAATLGCSGLTCDVGVWFYRSSDGGQTWDDLATVTPGDPRRELTTTGSDKEYLHVDQAASSPHRDNVYLTWHDNNVLQFARSADHGNTWSKLSFDADPLGIGSDITTDRDGNIFYVWPAFDSQQIVLKKSTDGGVSFAPGVAVVASTQGSYEFAVPSMDTRYVFIYVAAGADVSDGPFSGSVYLAWTDATAPTGPVAANNHARIQVAHSRDGGASWSVVTPHQTADEATVDRYHPWLAVGADGKVHVVFYDTRRSLDRKSVDLFYAVSVDGGASFSPPIRLTAEQSPKIGDSFEFGDYNGLDTAMNDVIAVFTDNRDEAALGSESVDVYAAGISAADRPQVTISSPSTGARSVVGTPISFVGGASDVQDGDLTASLAWSSSLDGPLGSGGAFVQTLAEGVHAVTAEVADSGGLVGSSSIALTVLGVSIFSDGFESGDVGAWSSK